MKPFEILGHNLGVFYYLPSGSGQVVALKLALHTRRNLLALAPLEWWGSEFRTRRGPDWLAAVNSLVQQSYSVGLYQPKA